MKKCPACKGSRKVMGMGFVYKDCVNCEGSGYTFDDEVEIKPKKKKSKKHDDKID